LARVLIVGCGCRGQELARALTADGHAVRGTTRDPARLEAIAGTGAEAVLADPDRVGTLVSALAAVTVVVWLLGSASGTVDALHGPRLRALLEKLVDTPVRGYVHEAAGDGDAELVREAARTWSIPVEIVEPEAGTGAARGAVGALLDSPSGQRP
jgi:nucleoside-diphosphate-sugar epimerase